MQTSPRLLLTLALAACCVSTNLAGAQRPPRMGPGMGMGMPMGPMLSCINGPPEGPPDAAQCPPGPILMSLLSQHDKISRQVKLTDTGIKSQTTSDDPKVAALIKAHVHQMRAVLDSCAKGQCSFTPAAHDPLFRAVYSNADKLNLQVTNIDKGVRVKEDGSTDAAKLLVQAHADVVSRFVKYGFPEHHRAHEVPAAARAGLKLD